MRLLLAAMLVLLPQVAAAKCMSKAEARAMYASHLYWSVGINGQCWARSMSEARAAAKTPQPKPPAKVQARPMLPVVVPVALPPQQETLDDPQWSWITEARAADREIKPLNIMPVPQPPTPRDNGSAFFLVLASTLVSTALWLLLARRFLRRLYPW